MDFTIRDAVSADLPPIRSLLAATWHDTYDGIYGKDRVTEITDRWHSMEALELGLRLPQSYFPVTIYGEKIVATALAGFDEKHVIDLRRLYTRIFNAEGWAVPCCGRLSINFPTRSK